MLTIRAYSKLGTQLMISSKIELKSCKVCSRYGRVSFGRLVEYLTVMIQIRATGTALIMSGILTDDRSIATYLELVMDNDVGIRDIIPHCHADESHKSLGVMLNLDDNSTLQVYRMIQIELQFGEKIKSGFITGQNVLYALNSTAMCSLNWPLPAITLS